MVLLHHGENKADAEEAKNGPSGKLARVRLAGELSNAHRHTGESESDSSSHGALHNDLENAKDVQKAFFPPENLSIPGLTCEIFYKPAHSIGGDYYDFLPLLTDRWGITIGDVSGKGIAAALLMAFLQASLRAQAMHARSDLSMLVADLDRVIHSCSPRHLYASLFYGEYDPATRLLKYVNAGHNAPIVLQWKEDQCKILCLEPSGTPLGLLEISHFSSQALQLEIGDVLVMYTDGITEAENSEHEFWGQHRLESLLGSCRDHTPAQIVRRILDEVLAFANGLSQKDDVTLIVIGVKDEAGL